MSRRVAVATLIMITARLAFAQSPAQPVTAPPSFEVATVKPSSPDARGRFFRTPNPRRFEAYNHTLKECIGYAYSLTPGLITGGPAWIDFDRYDIVGVIGTEPPAPGQVPLMFQALLTDRYGLRFHREQKQADVYNLVIGKSGLKMTESAPAPGRGGKLMVDGPPRDRKLPGRNATMGQFAGLMQRIMVDRPVVDRTGLTGRYDFELEWTEDTGTEANGAPNIPDIFGAVQQLGLKLEPAKAMVEVLVIDHVEKPDAN